MKAILSVGGVLLAFVLVLLLRAMMIVPPDNPAGEPLEITVDRERAAGHLAEAIRFPTVSNQNSVEEGSRDADGGPSAGPDVDAFEGFIAWAESAYPLVHAELELERVGTYSLLYKWQGRRPELAPVLLTGHYDVVPVIPGSESGWTHPPFGGTVADGYVWGRGALDDKCAVVALLEAATLLLEQGTRPERTVYLSMGHDEELGGGEGAAAVTELLRSRGVELAWSLDEGSYVLDDAYLGISAPLAPINVAEKGYLVLEVVAKGQGGHSSMPPRQTAVGTLAAAIIKLEQNPMPGSLDGFLGEMFEAITPAVPFGLRIVFANRWLFDPLIEGFLEGTSTGNAMLRTTTAATMLSASVKENVLPIEAIAVVNFRLHPRDGVEDVIAHVERVVDDPRIELRVRGNPALPSPVSSSDSQGYREIAAALRSIYSGVVVSPGLTVGGTDSRHYGQIAKDAYRLNPMNVTSAEISGFHGTNERIAVESLANGIAVYARLMAGGAAP